MDAPLALSPPAAQAFYLSPPDSGLPFDALLEATKAREGVRSRLPPLPPPRTPGMRLPTPKAFMPVMPDELGKWSAFFSDLRARHSFAEVCRATRGRHELTPLPPGTHPAAELHNKLRTGGAPVLFAPDTPAQDLEAALAYSCHRSATLAAAYVREELSEQVSFGHIFLLPWSQARDLPNLRLSPVGSIPQAGRRDRLIYDYTWSGTNRAVSKQAPAEAMQFGGALHRLLHAIVDADPLHGPVHMAKVDLSDAYMRIRLNLADLPKLAFVVPPHPSDPEPIIGFHLSLPMGFIESAPFFCASTETAADLINHSWGLADLAPAHPLEQFTSPPHPTPHRPTDGATRAALAYIDVFVDDFLALRQGTPAQLRQARRHVFHSLDLLFRPNDAHDRHRKTPNSIKKLRLGDADWTTQKKLLGWVVDSVRCLISLPPERHHKIRALLDAIPRSARRCTLLKWQILCGNLRSIAPMLPGGLGLFSCLYVPLKGSRNRIALTSAIHDELDDWRMLLASLAARPTHIREIIPDYPTWTGAHDASGKGMGGVFAGPDGTPYLWRHKWSASEAARLVTFSNPRDDLSINDFELA